MAGKRSNLAYTISGFAVFAVIVTAWVARDWFAAQAVIGGSQAPMFEAATPEGEVFSLSDYEGKVVLLNVWATWCPPCRTEMPSMQQLYEQFQHRDFEIVAVSVDAPETQRGADGMIGGNVRAFADSLSLTFPILHDPSARIQRSYRVRALPESFIIGTDGMIYRKVTGEHDWQSPETVSFIRGLLDEGA